jgi:hypothetical protein
MIRLTPRKWSLLQDHLAQQYPRSVMLIRDRMRRELGFLPRTHQEWLASGAPIKYVCLDFYDARMESWFVLKYSEWL